MRCGICARTAARIGVICEDCRANLLGPIAITGEQIAGAISNPCPAGLVDAWGGVHQLGPDTLIGRADHVDVLRIYEASVSRRHAWISQDTGQTWIVRDLGSVNGTFVDDIPATAPIRLRPGGRVRFGYVSFYFVADTRGLVPPSGIPPTAQTETPGAPVVLDQTAPILQDVSIKLHEPSGGGGGMIEVDGRSAQLTLAQFELLSRLISRMAEPVTDTRDAREDRGFIRSDQLVGLLSLDSMQPNEDNVRQLVRRVRRRLEEAGIGDLIESKYRLGYRLRVKPRTEP